MALAVGDKLELRSSTDGRLISAISGLSPGAPDATRVELTDDGRWVAIGYIDRPHEIGVWETESGRRVSTLLPGMPIAMRFSTGGQSLAVSDDADARVVDRATGEVRAVLHGHDIRITNIAFDSRDRRIATVSLDHTLRLWGTDGAPQAVLADVSPLLFVAFSPVDDFLLTTNMTEARVWDVAAGRPIAILARNSVVKIHIASSPSGDQTAVADWAGVITIWDTSRELPSVAELQALAACRTARTCLGQQKQDPTSVPATHLYE
jgi:WD40 repeat protein